VSILLQPPSAHLNHVGHADPQPPPPLYLNLIRLLAAGHAQLKHHRSAHLPGRTVIALIPAVGDPKGAPPYMQHLLVLMPRFVCRRLNQLYSHQLQPVFDPEETDTIKPLQPDDDTQPFILSRELLITGLLYTGTAVVCQPARIDHASAMGAGLLC
jgi:hypothetical protein